MNDKRLFPLRLYIRKFVNTFLPRILLKVSPNRFWSQRHWKSQDKGDLHGFDNYCSDRPTVPVIIEEIRHLVNKDAAILDAGCNCGYMLNRLKQEGYTSLTGVDINENALQYGRIHLNLHDVELIAGSFEDVLPRLYSENRKFQLVFTVGATVELVHPSFDVLHYLCAISDRYLVLIISLWGHSYPRFWEYEFNRHGFVVVKCITPYDGGKPVLPLTENYSLLLLQRIR
jgi:SAM-dependent methyltransferase